MGLVYCLLNLLFKSFGDYNNPDTNNLSSYLMRANLVANVKTLVNIFTFNSKDKIDIFTCVEKWLFSVGN